MQLDLQSVEIERRRERGPQRWETLANHYREIAGSFAEAGAYDEAWAAFKAADRELIHAYDTDELETEADRVRLEAANKLVEWRREFVLQRIPQRVPGTPYAGVATDSPAWTNIVKECRRVLDDALDNRYRKLGLLRYRLQWSALSLIASLLAALAAWLIAVNHGLNPSTATSLLSDWRSVLVVLSLGALGASLSGLLSIREQRVDARLPDLTEVWLLVGWRPVVGAASAFVLVLILQSGVDGLALTSAAAVVAALVAGFTERAVTSAIGSASAAIQRK